MYPLRSHLIRNQLPAFPLTSNFCETPQVFIYEKPHDGGRSVARSNQGREQLRSSELGVLLQPRWCDTIDYDELLLRSVHRSATDSVGPTPCEPMKLLPSHPFSSTLAGSQIILNFCSVGCAVSRDGHPARTCCFTHRGTAWVAKSDHPCSLISGLESLMVVRVPLQCFKEP